jgi:hypothetical protein
MDEDGLIGQKVELLFLAFQEALTLPGRDDDCNGLHRSRKKKLE